ncbi:MAG: hypothetical protein H6Q15_2138 [Bacteroidetes bacterium]|nr:hypothetical protein [Bacteroidota bacterium]
MKIRLLKLFLCYFPVLIIAFAQLSLEKEFDIIKLILEK